MGGPQCHEAHLVPVMPWLGLIRTRCWRALISTLGAMPAAQLLKDPPSCPPPPPEERRRKCSFPTDLGWERSPAWWGLGAMNVHGLGSPTLCQEEGGGAAPPAPLPCRCTCKHGGTHTSGPRAVGACLPVTPHHRPGVLLLGWLQGQETVSGGLGRQGWPHGSRGKASGVGARRKQACVAQAREQLKMHPQLLGQSAQPGRRGPSPQRWGAQHHGGAGCSHKSRAPRPQDPCGCECGRRSTPHAPMGAWLVPAASLGHPSATRLCPTERWASGLCAPGDVGCPGTGM